jgi:cytoskeleton protein RodZ
VLAGRADLALTPPHKSGWSGPTEKHKIFVGVEMEETDMQEAELPLEGVGARLMRARESGGLSRAQIAAQTRIPERHLAAIEAGDFAALPARTYSIGFSRSYAKAVGLDPDEVAADVRTELAALETTEPRRQIQTFEPGDPARVPSARLAWIAAAGVLIVLIGGLYLARSMFMPAGELASSLPEEGPAAVSRTAAIAPLPVGGAVVFTALQPTIWVKFTDGAGNQLLQKELAQGESYTIPEGQADVKLWTARPDALSITVGGQAVPKLSEVQQTMKDVPVSAAALLARGTAAAIPQPAPSTAAQPRSSAPERQRERRPAPQRTERPAATSSAAPSLAIPVAAPAAAAPAPTASAT